MEDTEKLKIQIESLETAQKSLVTLAREAAKAEYYYRLEKSKQALIERANGVPMSMLSDIVKGNEKIAKLRLDADIKQSLYDTAKEQINSAKFIARILHEQIERDFRG